MVEYPLSVKENLMKYCISLAIKASLRAENRTQYTNHQMINACQNEIYPKKSKYISVV